MKTVAFSGTNGGVSFSASGFDQALAEIGENTGNSLFQFAMWRQIRNPKYIISRESSPEMVHEVADILCIPAANQINPAWDLGGWANFVEKCDLPIVCIGLGAQAQLGGDPRLQLKPGTVRYLQIVSERSHTIGVRGAFTQQVLEHLGINNTIVTGCPSQTINSRLKGRDIRSLIENFGSVERPRVAYTLGTLEEYARRTEHRLAKLVSTFPHKIIVQTNPRFMRFLHDGNADEESVEFFKWVGSFVRPDLSAHEFMSYLAQSSLFYSDARTWIDQMRSTDLVLGMRIHGVVAAIQAARLGVCVAFDSRTEELAHTMGYPYVTHGEITDETTLKDIVRSARFSVERFDHLKVKNSEKIRKILAEAGCVLIQD